MDLAALRTWTIFYLISFVVLLWALFLTTQGVLLGFGLTLVLVVVGLNFFFVSLEVKRIAERRELMAALSESDAGDRGR
ncbi:MAG: hypothetical protein APR53_05240 [Methanoculleus sp. SDB]|nr:MAG: hypothetical protein APR53_05240 [Methanoculleus sp. SDB]